MVAMVIMVAMVAMVAMVRREIDTKWINQKEKPLNFLFDFTNYMLYIAQKRADTCLLKRRHSLPRIAQPKDKKMP